MRYYLYALSLALTGCDKKETNPQPEPKKDFTVGYFFNNGGDARLKSVALNTRTLYPDKNGPGISQQTFNQVYSDISATERIAHVFTEPHMRKTLYPGCVTNMEVILYFRKPVYSPFDANGTRTYRVFELPADTVTAEANCTRTFNWPADTLKYPELSWR
ncbi:hypothetical protein [Hymenobacter cellulosivorans]|uniref:DUF4843 domain-containing protein n=1 Tax=Hymenobacter cellulosivorans TaxID=2932249 RepID=A0ABY4FFN3_9BACT|nr:hypothetical protein [Hymenobacter cellulosivorans]UOQ54767.1 hypothetical protein MUN80_08405 [Hymenobacter cellulosivorans]